MGLEEGKWDFGRKNGIEGVKKGQGESGMGGSKVGLGEGKWGWRRESGMGKGKTEFQEFVFPILQP